MDIAAQVLLGYAVVALTPGPNMLLVAGVAALRGFAAAVSHCLGTAAAVAAIALAAHLAADAVPGSGAWMDALGAASGTLLLVAAFRMARTPPAAPGCMEPVGPAGFLAGFRVAVVNPATVAYFAAAFAGPLGGQGVVGLLVAAGASSLSLGAGLGTAAVLGRPSMRRVVLSRQRQFRLVTAALLALAAGSVLFRLMPGIAVAALP